MYPIASIYSKELKTALLALPKAYENEIVFLQEHPTDKGVLILWSDVPSNQQGCTNAITAMIPIKEGAFSGSVPCLGLPYQQIRDYLISCPECQLHFGMETEVKRPCSLMDMANLKMKMVNVTANDQTNDLACFVTQSSDNKVIKVRDVGSKDVGPNAHLNEEDGTLIITKSITQPWFFRTQLPYATEYCAQMTMVQLDLIEASEVTAKPTETVEKKTTKETKKKEKNTMTTTSTIKCIACSDTGLNSKNEPCPVCSKTQPTLPMTLPIETPKAAEPGTTAVTEPVTPAAVATETAEGKAKRKYTKSPERLAEDIEKAKVLLAENGYVVTKPEAVVEETDVLLKFTKCAEDLLTQAKTMKSLGRELAALQKNTPQLDADAVEMIKKLAKQL